MYATYFVASFSVAVLLFAIVISIANEVPRTLVALDFFITYIGAALVMFVWVGFMTLVGIPINQAVIDFWNTFTWWYVPAILVPGLVFLLVDPFIRKYRQNQSSTRKYYDEDDYDQDSFDYEDENEFQS